MKYISVCSGIEAASVAWHGLGWTPLAFSEVDAFPSAVLAERWPGVPNLGDMTKFMDWPEELLVECELLVGGTPCQAFSVAGLRKSLDDARGNLSLAYVQLWHRINDIRRKHGRSPAVALWENVPGVLSTKDNAFGFFVGGLLGCDEAPQTQDGKWNKAGFLCSESVRVGWRTLDAQYFGVAQRRRRVFLVAATCESVGDFGERACPSEILSLRESLLGNPPSRRASREEVAFDVAPCIGASGRGSARTGESRGQDYVVACGGIPETCGTLSDGAHMGGGKTGRMLTQVGSSLPSVSLCLNAGGMGRIDSETETLIPTTGGVFSDCSRPVLGNDRGRVDMDSGGLVVFDGTQITSKANRSDPRPGDPSHPLTRGGQLAVAFHSALGSRGGDVFEDRSTPTVRVGSGVGIPTPPAVAFKPSHFTRGKDGAPAEVVAPLSADADKSDQDTVIAHNRTVHEVSVRRLTPTECERLQGFPDGYTDIIHKNKPAADGPRCKAIGNSMAVPCMAWLGYRIASTFDRLPAKATPQ